AELARLHKELETTFIYITHSQSEAFGMADRVVVMSRGVIQQIGTPSEIHQRPANRFVAEFIGGNNIFSGTVASADGGRPAFETASRTLALDSASAFERGSTACMIVP